MNYFTSTKTHPVIGNTVLLLTRIFVGLAMMSHGLPKLQKLMDGGDVQFFDFLGMGASFSLILAVFAEFFCSVFLMLGLFTRWASFFLMFTMAVAAFAAHGDAPFAEKEVALLYMALYLMLWALGPGKFSVDAMIGKKSYSSRW
ncbi:DoxX family protein [Bergeyella sp. RCAD1439]|uniref:DoxX family protein n=1 Tax=Bergeyella anatis TaxID=3113737 RepID=UPI002E18BE22|nr:DoxX family protein [Bergeyella sp. RCAD1439]